MNPFPSDSAIVDPYWKTFFAALGDPILVITGDGRLDYANPPALALLGCQDAGEMANLWESSLKSFAAAAFGPSPAGSVLGVDFVLPGDDRKRLSVDAYPLTAATGLRVLIVRDRAAEEAARGDLRLIGRYRSLASLYHTMGHDLKAPLNALTINLDLLKTCLGKIAPVDPSIRERLGRYQKVFEDELARLNRSLQTFLAQAIPPTQETIRPFNLREVMMDLAALIAPQARQQQVRVEVEMDERDLMLEGQRDLLKQALLNMAVNALEAMPGGGRLKLELETGPGRVTIQLQDTGPGIAPEAMDKIWELPYSTKKNGIGIGLYVARSVIESFGGTLGVESRAGQGTCFTIVLPAAREED